MILGYEINGFDAKKKMLGDNLELAPPHPCNPFRSIYEINFLPDNFQTFGLKYDFYDTADGYFLISGKAKRFCEKNNYKGLEFIPLPGANYFWLKSQNIIEYDMTNQYLNRSEYDDKCKGYREVTSPTPVFLLTKKPLDDNFFRTDLCFGRDGKFPLMCIGISTYKKIKKANLKGGIFSEILDEYDSKKLPDLEHLKRIDDPDFSFLTLTGYKKNEKK